MYMYKTTYKIIILATIKKMLGEINCTVDYSVISKLLKIKMHYHLSENWWVPLDPNTHFKLKYIYIIKFNIRINIVFLYSMRQKRYWYCEYNSVMKCYNTFIIITCTILMKKLIDENEHCITTFVLEFCVMEFI